MTFEEAKELLTLCYRDELRDHAFGDAEVSWMDVQNKEVAGGYFGSECHVWIKDSNKTEATFTGELARALRKCGKVGKIERNDETGPDTYHEGECLPALTLESVWQELTGK